MDFFQRIAAFVTSGEFFTFIAFPARAFDQIADFKIEPVIRATRGGVSARVVRISNGIAAGIVFCIVIPVPRSHKFFLSCRI
jgi:hypothetical protein